mmetsp:Transcript_34465/g.41646  ORF Transcript_34465/g.41646 Transcript_34465/m.41646 type:complete len:782 (+) Transcript_34465:177-2522(+)
MGVCGKLLPILVVAIAAGAFVVSNKYGRLLEVPTLGVDPEYDGVDPYKTPFPPLKGKALQTIAKIVSDPRAAPLNAAASKLLGVIRGYEGMRGLADQVEVDDQTLEDFWPWVRLDNDQLTVLRKKQESVCTDTKAIQDKVYGKTRGPESWNHDVLQGGVVKIFPCSRENSIEMLNRIVNSGIKVESLLEDYKFGIKLMNRRTKYMAAMSTELMRMQLTGAAVRWDNRVKLSVCDPVPVLFSDDMNMTGITPTNGRKSDDEYLTTLEDYEEKDARDLMIQKTVAGLNRQMDPLYKRVLDLGYVVYGTTMQSEDGWGHTGWNDHKKGPHNVYNRARMSGGAQGGLAVGVAAGTAPVAMGRDSMGSVLLPAAWNGVFACRTTMGYVPVMEAHWGNKVLSPVIVAGTSIDMAVSTLAVTVPRIRAQTVRNKKGHEVYNTKSNYSDWRYYNNIYAKGMPPLEWDAQFHGTDMYQDLNYRPDNYTNGDHMPYPLPYPAFVYFQYFKTFADKGFKVAVIKELYDSAAGYMQESFKQALKLMKLHGIEILEFSMPHLQHLAMAGDILAAHSRNELQERHLIGKFNLGYDAYLDTTKLYYEMAARIEPKDLKAAQKLQFWAHQYVTKFMAENNITMLAAPSVPFIAPKAHQEDVLDLELTRKVSKYFCISSLVGLPTMTMPMGHETKTKMPLGLMLMAKHWHEHEIMRFAYMLENQMLMGQAQRVLPYKENYWSTRRIGLVKTEHLDDVEVKDSVTDKHMEGSGVEDDDDDDEEEEDYGMDLDDDDDDEE